MSVMVALNNKVCLSFGRALKIVATCLSNLPPNNLSASSNTRNCIRFNENVSQLSKWSASLSK